MSPLHKRLLVGREEGRYMKIASYRVLGSQGVLPLLDRNIQPLTAT